MFFRESDPSPFSEFTMNTKSSVVKVGSFAVLVAKAEDTMKTIKLATLRCQDPDSSGRFATRW